MPINQQKNARALEQLTARLRGKSRPLALTGAGVSVWSGYGTWAEVIADLARAVRDSNPGINTATIVQTNRNPLHCAQNLGANNCRGLSSRFPGSTSVGAPSKDRCDFIFAIASGRSGPHHRWAGLIAKRSISKNLSRANSQRDPTGSELLHHSLNPHIRSSAVSRV